MQALYYLSALAEATLDIPKTPISGLAGQVILPQAGNPTNVAPTIQQPPAGNAGTGPGALVTAHRGQEHQVGHQGIQILSGYEWSECARYDLTLSSMGFSSSCRELKTTSVPRLGSSSHSPFTPR